MSSAAVFENLYCYSLALMPSLDAHPDGYIRKVEGSGEQLVVSLRGGNWEGSTAMAAGLLGGLNETFSIRGSASLGSGNAWIGASVGWRLK